MKILYGTMQVTATILIAYLVISIGRDIPAINRNIADSQKAVAPLQQQLDKQQEMLAALQAEVTSFHKEVNERIAKEEKRKEITNSVLAAMSKTGEADEMRKTGDLNKAAEILLSTKEALWKAGDFFQADQAAFRGLMVPIDAVVSKWKSGNGTVDTSKVSAAIKPLLDKITRD